MGGAAGCRDLLSTLEYQREWIRGCQDFVLELVDEVREKKATISSAREDTEFARDAAKEGDLEDLVHRFEDIADHLSKYVGVLEVEDFDEDVFEDVAGLWD